ncbi:hypothetical protein PMAYCL1PPCAC_31284, partial [Pristionchus mayeri]
VGIVPGGSQFFSLRPLHPIMISARSCLLISFTLAHVHLTSTRVIQPHKVRAGQDTFYIHGEQLQLARSMLKAYNQSIPMEAAIACKRQHATVCPSPSADGSHRCINIGDICDHR